MTTLNLQMGASADDGQQHSGTSDQARAPTGSGVVVLNDAIMQPGGHGLNNMWCAIFRFTGVTIAQGSTINSANFILTPQATWNAGANVIKYYVSAQASDNPAALTTASGSFINATRPRSTAFAVWLQTAVVVDVEQSVSVTAIVQEIVNRAGFASGNALAIILDPHEDITDTEWQDYQAYDGSAAKSAKLQIDYTAGGAAARILRAVPIMQAVKRSQY